MMAQTIRRPRVLFVAESVTLAHFARPVALARTLDPALYDIYFASAPRYLALLGKPSPFTFRAIHSISSADFCTALAQGKPLYSAGTLEDYVKDDLSLLEETRPDLVIGDFRLSLAVSAPLAAVPYASIVNAYWSPYARIPYIIPELPLVRLLGVKLSQILFDAARPFVFALHSMPLNRVRRRHGQASLGYDLRRVYSQADYTLYADMPGLVPMDPLPGNHRFIGPVMWSPDIDTPDWWDALPGDRPIIYVTLGSSGQAEILPLILRALARMPVTVIASSAGQVFPDKLPGNVYAADYLPGNLATGRASLVVCNGGSLTTYQALSAGVPIVGVASNMDQFLNMQAIESLGAGITVRAGTAETARIQDTAATVLENTSYSAAARHSANMVREYDSSRRFPEFVAGLLAS